MLPMFLSGPPFSSKACFGFGSWWLQAPPSWPRYLDRGLDAEKSIPPFGQPHDVIIRQGYENFIVLENVK